MNHAGPQDPHTILFGKLRGDTFYDEGVAFNADFPVAAFAADFSDPARSRQLTFTLYRIDGVRHSVVWSVTQPVSKDAIGFADTLAQIRDQGNYGFGVTRGIFLLAWGNFVILPPCSQTSCSGG